MSGSIQTTPSEPEWLSQASRFQEFLSLHWGVPSGHADTVGAGGMIDTMKPSFHVPRWVPAAGIAVPLALGATAMAQATTGQYSSASGAQCAPPPHRPPGGAHRPGPGRGGWVGTVEQISGGTFTLAAGAQTYGVETSSTTIYTWGRGWDATRSALTAGESVAVTGALSGSQITAKQVQIRLPGVQGRVTAVQSRDIDIEEASGRTATVEVPTTPMVSVGQVVQAVGTWERDTLRTSAWRVVPAHVDGTVVAVSSGQATLQLPSGQRVTLTWTSGTTFRAGPGQSASASNLAVGEHVHAMGQWHGTTFEASEVDVRPAPPVTPNVS